MDVHDRLLLLREIAYVERFVTERRRDLDLNLQDLLAREMLERAQARLVELNAKLHR